MLLGILALLATTEDFFLDAQHPVSKRHAILERQGSTAYLYLTVPGKPRPESDVVVFTTGPLVTEAESLRAGEAGGAPPLTVADATKEAVVVDAKLSQFTFRWSRDGNSVAVIRSGKPVAMIVAGRQRGFSRALARKGFFGAPWEQALFESVFGK